MMLCTNTMLSRVRVGSPLTLRATEETRVDAGNGLGAALGSVCSTGSSVLGIGQGRRGSVVLNRVGGLEQKSGSMRG